MVALDLMAGLQPPVLAVAVAQQIRVRMVHPLRGAMGVMELRLAFLGLQFLTLVGVGAGLNRPVLLEAVAQEAVVAV